LKLAITAVAGVMVLTLGLGVYAQEGKAPLKDVPKVVLDAVHARFPHAQVTSATTESEDGETVYELSLVNDAKRVTVNVDGEGEIDEIETEIAVSDLPPDAADAIAEKLPHGTITKAEEVVEIDEGAEHKGYEVAVATPDGKSVEVKLDAHGSIRQDEDEEAEGAEGGEEPAEAAAQSGDWTSDFSSEKADLVPTGRNPYFILEPGYQIVLEGGDARVVITVLHTTKTVNGVETRVVEERETEGDRPVEVSRNYYAISKRTNSVYYFGEDVDEYRNGHVAGHGGSWLAGVDGAQYGLMMPGLPLLGAKYCQELAPGKAMDRAEVVALTAEMKTPAGDFEDCLKTEETSALEPGNMEYKHYAPGIGQAQDGSLRLARYGMVNRGRD